MYRVIISALALFIANAALAVESEYKNTLTKVELNKSSDSSYSVNLYTSKKMSEPVKVIKKSDLNYYILLPETKNLTQNTSASNSDIRNVNTQVYPYAGADIQNGYTKININTTVQTASNPQTTITALNETKKQETTTAMADTKVQKKKIWFKKSKKVLL